jgi:hypothetical protein
MAPLVCHSVARAMTMVVDRYQTLAKDVVEKLDTESKLCEERLTHLK